VVAITPTLIMQACALVQVHPLRAYDAIHLAGALAIQRILQQQELPAALFVAADDVLLAAATAEGFVVDNPLLHP
jgi:hypothetical protein